MGKPRRIAPDRIPDLKEKMIPLIFYVDDLKVWRYADGVSDLSLSEEFNCSPVAVAKLRNKWFGKLYTQKKSKSNGSFDADAYETVVEKYKLMENTVKSLTDRINIIEDYITRNPKA